MAHLPRKTMRTLLALAAIAVAAVFTAPFVLADGPEPQREPEGKLCPGTFGEYRVHCLAALKHTDA